MHRLVAYSLLAMVAITAGHPQQQARRAYGPPRQGNGGGYQQQQQQQPPRTQKPSYGNYPAGQTTTEASAPMPYQFQWEVKDPESGNDYSHQQASDGTMTQGEYRVLLPDTRVQIVRFTADMEKGYVAEVTYEGEAVYPPRDESPMHLGVNGNKRPQVPSNGNSPAPGAYKQQQQPQQQQRPRQQQQQQRRGAQRRPAAAYGPPRPQ